MKKYAVITGSAFGKLWYFEEDLPEEWWTSIKSKAMLFNSLKGAESKALWIVSKYPDMIGKIELYEGEETEFGRQKVERGSLAQGPAGDLLGTIWDTLFGDITRGSVPGRIQRSEEAPSQDSKKDGEGGDLGEPRNRRRPS